jgi:hypothetical protein
MVAILVALLTVGCRMEIGLTIDLGADGSGQVLVEIIADPALTAALPPGADLVLVDDARQAGWSIEGPTPTDDGGLRILMTKTTTSMEEIASAIADIGPPLSVTSLERRADTKDGLISQIVSQFSVRATLPNGDQTEGFAIFSDPELTSVLGGLPFGQELLASGAAPATSMGFTLEISAAGQVSQHSGQVISENEDRSVVRWSVPMDGSTTEISMTTVQRPDGTAWAGGMSTLLLAVLLLWVIASGAFITWVILARRRRALARRAAIRRTPVPQRDDTV